MRAIGIPILFASLGAAHFAPKSLIIDGNSYLARDARLDDMLSAKRIEWSFKDVNNFVWQALTNVLDPSITCGIDAKAPSIKAVARAGANITVQWSPIVRHHKGPSMSYLGAWPSSDTKVQDVKFFKFHEKGYDRTRNMWANEFLIEQGFTETFPLPSDIKPGLYIFRTELLSLHGNGVLDGPQFYTHCFNIEILGNGTIIPEGVTFPGGYKKDEAGVNMKLTAGQAAFNSYVVPGPPVYKGRYDPPTGSKPIVTPADVGDTFPPEFNTKYLALVDKYNNFTSSAFVYFDGGAATTNAGKFFQQHELEGRELATERGQLREEAIKLGIANPTVPSPTARVFR